MKKYQLIITVILSICFNNLYAQEKYSIKWKIDTGDIIAYQTIMEDIDTGIIEEPVLLKEMKELYADSITNEEPDLNDFYKSMKKDIEDLTTITILKRKKEWIDVQLIVENIDSDTTEDSLGFSGFMKGVQLRGLLNQNGEIQSFYTKNRQKNLLALFFQLPSHDVAIGDKWSIDMNWLQMDQNFDCDTMSKINEVKLIDIIIEGKDTIAVISYKNYEMVKGNYFSPFSKEPIESFIDSRYDAICEFSINEGKWRNYSGILSIFTSGYQDSSYKQRFVLFEKEVIPEKIKKHIK
jgi:hypothetical protein